MSHIEVYVWEFPHAAHHRGVVWTYREHIDHHILLCCQGAKSLLFVECEANCVLKVPEPPVVEPNILPGNIPESLNNPLRFRISWRWRELCREKSLFFQVESNVMVLLRVRKHSSRVLLQRYHRNWVTKLLIQNLRTLPRVAEHNSIRFKLFRLWSIPRFYRRNIAFQSFGFDYLRNFLSEVKSHIFLFEEMLVERLLNQSHVDSLAILFQTKIVLLEACVRWELFKNLLLHCFLPKNRLKLLHLENSLMFVHKHFMRLFKVYTVQVIHND